VGNADADKAAAAASGPPGADARIGTVVDKYTIVRMLGRGGMGAVYEGRHAMLARRVAIKFLLPEFAANRDILRRFENEAKAAGGLEHPNVAAVTDFGRASDGSPYLVMDFLEGEDCAKLLRRSGTLSVARAANIVIQACRGLAVAHKATIVHRDLKPENLFVMDAGDGSDLVKVLDFGIAKLRSADASVITGTGATFGTAYYMSPEQARGAGEVDPRTDVWSMGVVLYEFLSGRKPFAGELFLQVIHQILAFDPPALSTLRPDLPPAVVAAVERAMTKDLAARIPSVTALAEALAPFSDIRSTGESPRSAQSFASTLATPATNARGLSVGARTGLPVAPQVDAPLDSSRSVGRRGVLALAVVVLVGVLAVLFLRRASERSAPLDVAAGRTAPAAPATAMPETKPPTHSAVDLAAPSGAPAAMPATTGAGPIQVPAPLAPAAATPNVRTVFEHSGTSLNRHSARPAAKQGAATAPTPPSADRAPSGPSLAPTLEKPTPSHRIEIDKDDPYGAQ
jgi:serine/threonine protein kinase